MKNKAAQELGRLSAKKRDTSSKAMSDLVQKRWEKKRLRDEGMKAFAKKNPWIPEDKLEEAYNQYEAYEH